MKVDTEKGKSMLLRIRSNCLKAYHKNTTRGNRLPQEEQTKGIIQYFNSGGRLCR